MEALRRKLEAASSGLYNCTVSTNCGEDSLPFEPCWRCVYLAPPPIPPPPAGHESAKNHVVPYLVSIVCALGVAFLILTTCTIVLRYRWTRQRNSRRVASSREAVFIDEDRGPVDYPIWHIVTVGLPQSIIDSITVVKYKRTDGLIDGADCSVCLTEFEDGDDLRLLPKCSHAFHLSCIDTWLRSHKNCPVCRAPVVNDSSAVNSAVLGSNSSQSASSGVVQMEDSDVDPAGSGEIGQTRDGCDECETLSVEGIRISEILKSNQQIRVLSDLGQNHRVLSEDLQPVRRSISLDASASSAIINDVVVNIDGEGSSKPEKTIEEEEEAAKDEHQDSSLSRMMKSTSIGRSLQKAPVSVIRSFSSSAKIISSLRGSKSQPL